MGRLCLYYIPETEKDRWVFGDRHIRRLLRRVFRGTPRVGGIDRVFLNLCLGLDKLRTEYSVNVPFKNLGPDDRVGVFGRGRQCLRGYTLGNPIVAGIGLMTHPSEWPTLCDDYPVAKYLQHSIWASNVYKPYFGDRCDVWPVGIDTEEWAPFASSDKCVDFLIYNKILWDYERTSQDLLVPIRSLLKRKGLSFEEIRYGTYHSEDYRCALARSRAMIFLCEHESQGLAYQECLSTDVPILAWEQGRFLDPNRFRWGIPEVSASSVPYWDERCGEKFMSMKDFPLKLEIFLEKHALDVFAARSYILENLTLQKCAEHYLRLCSQVFDGR